MDQLSSFETPEVVQAAIDDYGKFVTRVATQGHLDGDFLLIPTCIIAFVLGWSILRCYVEAVPRRSKPQSHLEAALDEQRALQSAVKTAPAAPAAPAAAAAPAAPAAVAGPAAAVAPLRLNTTRAAMRRAAKAAGKKLRTRPEEIDELKMILVLRKDLKLSAAAAAELCATAAIAAVETCASAVDDGAEEGQALWSSYLRWWNEEGVAKVTVRADSIEDLKRVQQDCADAMLPCAYVGDAVIAVGPAPVDDVDEICGDFKLY